MRRRRIVPLVLVAGLAVGCTGSSGSHHSSGPSTPTPASTPPSTSVIASTSPSPTPTATSPSVATTGPNVRPGEKPPTLPKLAKQNSRLGAVQFAIYWFKTLDWGYATTDSALTRSASSSSCSECARLAAIIDRAEQAGDHFSGGRISVMTEILADDAGVKGATAAVDVTYDQTSIKVFDQSGKQVGSAKAVDKYERRLWLAWSDGRWRALQTKAVVR